MAIDCIAEIPGAVELSNWFGGFPSFHDAKADIQINGNGTGWLKVYGFRMTDEVDPDGHFVLGKRFAATFFLEELKSVSISEFMPGLAILDELDVLKSGDWFELKFFDTAYGFHGSLIAGRVRIEFTPGERF